MKNQKGSLKSTLAVSLTNYLDAGAIVAGASGLSLWQNYLSLSEAHLGWLNFISANCLGAAIGAIIGGFLADKYGRKAIYTYNMLVYMLGVLIIMVATNFPTLFAGFLVTGVSVGVGVPASWTYISESSETANRGRNICISQMAWGIGPLIILILGTLLAPATGDAATGGLLFPFVETVASLFGVTDGAALGVFTSRIVFASLFVVAFVAWLLQRQLNESEEWKAAKAAEKSSGVKQPSVFSSFGALFSNKTCVKSILFLVGMYLTWNLVCSVMGFFQPHIYETAGGLSNEMANLFAAGQWVVIILMTFVCSLIVDKVNQRWLFASGVSMGVIAWIIVITIGINSMAGLIIFTLLWAMQAGISVQTFYALWASELFPAKFRAAAQGVMFFIVRGLSAVWGLVFVYIYGENGEGFTLAGSIMLTFFVIALLIGFIGAPNTQGKSLEEITRERYGDNV